MTKFLSWSEGETKVLVVNSLTPVVEAKHWFGNKSYPCTAPDCRYCDAGFEPRARDLLLVDWRGTEYTWAMSQAVSRTLRASAPDPDNLKGLQLEVARTGIGMATRYDIRGIATEAPKPQAAGDEVPRVSGADEQVLAEIVQSLEEAGSFIDAAREKLIKLRYK